MYKLVTQSQLALAENSLRSLRTAVSNTSKDSVGNEARGQIHVLGAYVNATSVAIDTLRCDIHNPSVRALIQEYERLEKSARDIVEELTTNAAYDGPRRSAMTVKQKAAYISANGSSQYESLPW